jgi:hypothetical protein
MALSITLGRAKFNSERIGVSIAVLARIVNMSASKLSDAFRDVRKLSSLDEVEIENVVTRLANFHAAFAPLELPRNWEQLRELTITSVTPDEAAHFVAKLFSISKDPDPS